MADKPKWDEGGYSLGGLPDGIRAYVRQTYGGWWEYRLSWKEGNRLHTIMPGFDFRTKLGARKACRMAVKEELRRREGKGNG